jgi:hypothetical protein
MVVVIWILTASIVAPKSIIAVTIDGLGRTGEQRLLGAGGTSEDWIKDG